MSGGWTPGPWRVERHPESKRADAVYGSAAGKVAYCQAMFGRPHVPPGQWEANAHLIAAAPALYEALEPLMMGIDASQWHAHEGERFKRILVAETAIERARQALALARPSMEGEG